jgi:hypothetical protein
LEPFAIFPSNGLDQSLHAPVLVGLVVLTFFREALGWGYAGLVVPGYLATVFLAAPLTGGLMLLEGLVGYFLSAAVGRVLARTGAWSELFGRERFLLIIVCALLTRLALEAYWVPLLVDRYGFTHSRELYSIGLVLVPLLANTFWNAGLLAALPRIAFVTLVTWLFVSQVLLAYTNFTLSRFQIANESVSLAFLETPHAYIILVLGAVLAARNNVLYGWDFNGILVPALLAVAWYEPQKLLTTMVEALLVLFLAKRLALLPPFSKLLIVGSRRMLMAYGTGFVVKWLLGFVALRFAPNLQTIDYFGFGYLLPSLLAVKMWNTERIGRVLMPTLQVSLSAFVLGSAVSLVLGYLDPPRVLATAGSGVERTDSVALELMAGDSAPVPREAPTPWGERTLAQQALAVASDLADGKDPGASLSGARSLRLKLARGPDDSWVLVPRSLDPNDDRSAPRAALRPKANSRPWLVVVEAPEVGSPGVVLGVELSRLLTARGLVLRSRLPAQQELDDAFIGKLVTVLGIEDVLVLRIAAGTPSLSVVGLLPPGLPASQIEALLAAPLAVGFRAAESGRGVFQNRPRLTVPQAVAEAAAARLLAAPTLEAWVEPLRGALASRAQALTSVLPGRFERPSIEALRLYSALLARRTVRAREPPSAYERAFAGALGYRFASLGPRRETPDAWVLFEPAGDERKGQATFVQRRRDASGPPGTPPLLVELPAPRYERGALGATLSLFEALDADALLLAGALPRAAPEQAADPRRPGGRQSHYQVTHEAWLQQAGTALSIHGISPGAERQSDVVVAFQRPARSAGEGPAWTQPIVRLLGDGGFSVRVVDGTPELDTYSGSLDPPMAYARRFGQDQMMLAWFSEEARRLFTEEKSDDETAGRLERAHAKVRDESVAEAARAAGRCATDRRASPLCNAVLAAASCDAKALALRLERYNELRNPLELHAGLTDPRGCALDFVRDAHSGALWSLIAGKDDVWLVPFRPGPPRPRQTPAPGDLERAVAFGLATLRVPSGAAR